MRAAFDFGVTALNRIEVEFGGIGTGVHARGCTPTQTDSHAGAAELDQQRSDRQRKFFGVACIDAAHAPCDHDGLVIAANHAAHILLIGSKESEQVGTTEFIVEGCTPEGALDHDVECTGNAVGLAIGRLRGA